MTTLRYLGFGLDGPSAELRQKLAEQDDQRCLEGNPSSTVLRVHEHGSVALCDLDDCEFCFRFAAARRVCEAAESDAELRFQAWRLGLPVEELRASMDATGLADGRRALELAVAAIEPPKAPAVEIYKVWKAGTGAKRAQPTVFHRGIDLLWALAAELDDEGATPTGDGSEAVSLAWLVEQLAELEPFRAEIEAWPAPWQAQLDEWQSTGETHWVAQWWFAFAEWATAGKHPDVEQLARLLAIRYRRRFDEHGFLRSVGVTKTPKGFWCMPEHIIAETGDRIGRAAAIDDDDLTDLISSIAEHGQQVPVQCRLDRGRPRIVLGFRRHQAFLRAHAEGRPMPALIWFTIIAHDSGLGRYPRAPTPLHIE